LKQAATRPTGPRNVVGKRPTGPGTVTLSPAGVLALNGKPMPEASIETARLIEIGQSPFAHISKTQRETLLTSLSKALQKKAPRKSSEESLLARSAAATLLLSLARTSDGPVQTQALTTYVRAMKNEPNVQLRRSMWVNLDQTKLEIPRASGVLANEVKEQLLPSQPAYQDWFKGQAKPKLEVRHYVMDDFWKQDVAGYRKRGFELVSQTDDRAEFKTVLKDPTGKNADVATHVVLHKTNDNVLRDIDDPKVQWIIYSGHAQLGAVIDAAVARAPRKMSGTKLVQLYNCRAGQSQQDMLSRWENLHLTSTRKSSYGEDDAQVLTQTFNMVAKRGGYDEVKKGLKSADLIQPESNYMLPNDPRNLLTRDSDKDGTKDVSVAGPDRFFDPARRLGTGGNHSFELSNKSFDPQKTSATKVGHGTGFLNTSFYYFTEENRAAPITYKNADRFLPGGWFVSDKNEPVRITEMQRDGKTWYKVGVNSRLAPRSREVITAYQVMEAQLHLSKKQNGKITEKDKLRGAMLVAEYLELYVDTSTQVDQVLKGFTKHYGITGFDYDVYFDASRTVGHDNGTKAIGALKKAGVRA
jgi:hypothetical protein